MPPKRGWMCMYLNRRWWAYSGLIVATIAAYVYMVPKIAIQETAVKTIGSNLTLNILLLLFFVGYGADRATRGKPKKVQWLAWGLATAAIVTSLRFLL